jgi:hypothetical protein
MITIHGRPPDLIVTVEDAAADTDMLSGTELDTPVSNGVGIVCACSSVDTATMEIPQAGHKVGVTNKLPLSTQRPSDDDVIGVFPIRIGERPILSLGGTTGDCYTRVSVWFS